MRQLEFGESAASNPVRLLYTALQYFLRPASSVVSPLPGDVIVQMTSEKITFRLLGNFVGYQSMGKP